ncbi:hypothetical protein IG193_01070 [Infirmifilum lucidum]|uniref:Uncharacterized protein n=1 Tax=Infirmifilum lucidum TaxID=2776706 RepID=A0A7L9FGY1_9CREN|nr:hypothetical protein [Infirmifilum lucidum]QOJ79088.1 hypothetical protein IG193_01070 [Infirmifilum lucidum]
MARPRALAVALLYTAVMEFFTFLVVYYPLAAWSLTRGGLEPLITRVVEGGWTYAAPTPLLALAVLGLAPLYLWHGYTSYTRGNKRALLIPPAILGLLAALALVGAAGGVWIAANASCTCDCKAQCSPCPVKTAQREFQGISLNPLGVGACTCKCECYPCKP